MDEDRARVDEAVGRLARDYPMVPWDAVVSLFSDSYRTVVEASGQPLVDRAEDLTRMRLDIRVA